MSRLQRGSRMPHRAVSPLQDRVIDAPCGSPVRTSRWTGLFRDGDPELAYRSLCAVERGTRALSPFGPHHPIMTAAGQQVARMHAGSGRRPVRTRSFCARSTRRPISARCARTTRTSSAGGYRRGAIRGFSLLIASRFELLQPMALDGSDSHGPDLGHSGRRSL